MINYRYHSVAANVLEPRPLTPNTQPITTQWCVLHRYTLCTGWSRQHTVLQMINLEPFATKCSAEINVY